MGVELCQGKVSTPTLALPLQGGGDVVFNGWLGFILLLCTALSSVFCVNAQAAPPTEYEVKAAFIHNIAKFVEWPDASRSGGALRLCLLGQNPFGNALDALRGKVIGDKVWEIVPVNQQTNLSHCQVLFIAASESDKLGQVLENIKGDAVLTVADSDGFAGRGVMVNFYLEQNRVRFEINRDAASRGGFRISSQLLKLARIVAPAGGVQ